MKIGTVCPDGFLPAYSVDTEAEAKRLLLIGCSLGLDGEYYARELINPMTGEEYTGTRRAKGFTEFALKLERIHKMTLDKP